MCSAQLNMVNSAKTSSSSRESYKEIIEKIPTNIDLNTYVEKFLKEISFDTKNSVESNKEKLIQGLLVLKEIEARNSFINAAGFNQNTYSLLSKVHTALCDSLINQYLPTKEERAEFEILLNKSSQKGEDEAFRVAEAAVKLHIRLVEKWEWSNEEILTVLSNLSDSEKTLIKKHYQDKYHSELLDDAKKDLGTGKDFSKFISILNEKNRNDKNALLPSTIVKNETWWSEDSSINFGNQELFGRTLTKNNMRNRSENIYEYLRKNACLVDISDVKKYKDSIAKELKNTENNGPESEKRLFALYKLLEQTAKIRKNENDQLVNTIACVGTCLVVTAVAVGGAYFTGGQSLWLLGTLTATTSFATTAATKSFLKGDSYSLSGNEIKHDLVYSAIEGVMLPVGGAIGLKTVGNILLKNGLISQGSKLSSQVVFRALETSPFKFKLLQNFVEATSGEFLTGFCQSSFDNSYLVMVKDKSILDATKDVMINSIGRAALSGGFSLGLHSVIKVGSLALSKINLISPIDIKVPEHAGGVKLSLKEVSPIEGLATDRFLKYLGFHGGVKELDHITLEQLNLAFLSKRSQMISPQSYFFGVIQNESSILIANYRNVLQRLNIESSTEVKKWCEVLAMETVGTLKTHHPRQIQKNAITKVEKLIRANKGKRTGIESQIQEIEISAEELCKRVLLPEKVMIFNRKNIISFVAEPLWSTDRTKIQGLHQQFVECCKLLNLSPHDRSLLDKVNDQLKFIIRSKYSNLNPEQLLAAESNIQKLIGARNFLLLVKNMEFRESFISKIFRYGYKLTSPLMDTLRIGISFIKYAVWFVPPNSLHYLQEVSRGLENYFQKLLPIRSKLLKGLYLPVLLKDYFVAAKTWTKQLIMNKLSFGLIKKSITDKYLVHIGNGKYLFPEFSNIEHYAKLDSTVRNVFNPIEILKTNEKFGLHPILYNQFKYFSYHSLTSAFWLLGVPFILNQAKSYIKDWAQGNKENPIIEVKKDISDLTLAYDFKRFILSDKWQERITKRFKFIGNRAVKNTKNSYFAYQMAEAGTAEVLSDLTGENDEDKRIYSMAVGLAILDELFVDNTGKLLEFLFDEESPATSLGNRYDFLVKKYFIKEKLDRLKSQATKNTEEELINRLDELKTIFDKITELDDQDEFNLAFEEVLKLKSEFDKEHKDQEKSKSNLLLPQKVLENLNTNFLDQEKVELVPIEK